MNKLPNISLNFSSPQNGLVYKVELDLSLLLPKLQELFGVDLQPIAVPMLAQLVRKKINTLEKSKELKCLTSEDDLELKTLQEQEQKLYSWMLKPKNHE